MMESKRSYWPFGCPPEVPILFVLMVFVSSACAQSITNQTNLYIPAGMSFRIDGDFVNEGFVQNQGSFFVSGNWKNTNVYQGIGTVILNGSLRQSFFNNKNPINHLVAAGIGVKDIDDLVPIASRLDLLLGIVNVGDGDTIILAQTATVGGGSFISHVDGELMYAGVGYKFFPIGKNGNYHPVEMLNITGINPITTLEVFENLPIVNSPPGITLYRKIFWFRKNIRGTYIDSPLTIGFQIPDNYTNRHVIEIVEGDSLKAEFSALGRVSVTYDDVLDKVVSANGLTGRIFVLGESTPTDGIVGKFYISTSLSPRASNTDNQTIKIFGNQLGKENFRFLVYNRWGLLMFESASLEDMIISGWDGRSQSNGDYLPSGAYPYVLQALTRTGEAVEKKGIISIVN